MIGEGWQALPGVIVLADGLLLFSQRVPSGDVTCSSGCIGPSVSVDDEVCVCDSFVILCSK